VSWYGFVLTRRTIEMKDLSFWALASGDQFRRYEIAGRRVPGDWSAWAKTLLGADPEADWIEYNDTMAGTYRAVFLHEERIESCVFVSPRPDLPSRTWLASLFAKPGLDHAERASLLAGRPADPAADAGATICACFGVGRNAIEAAIREGCADPHSLGKRLKAGTNCGSCVPELRRLIASVAAGAQ